MNSPVIATHWLKAIVATINFKEKDMSKFIVEIRTDNSAYEYSFHAEIIANLNQICGHINSCDSNRINGTVRDTNGNKVGIFYTLTDGESGGV